MLQFDDQVRFTTSEIERARQLGIDIVGVKTKADYSDAVIEFVATLERERPELLERIARDMLQKSALCSQKSPNKRPRRSTVDLVQPSSRRSANESRLATNWCPRTHQAFRLHGST